MTSRSEACDALLREWLANVEDALADDPGAYDAYVRIGARWEDGDYSSRFKEAIENDLQAASTSSACEARLRMRDEVLSRWFASYPEDVFLPLSAPQVADAMKAIQATGITSDALYGGWARHILFHVMSDIKKADEELLAND
jgi:hypothetical protein